MSGFHPRDLITEVRIRPGIYNKDELEHPARRHKQRLWLEVAERLTPPDDWESFSDVEKEVRMGEIATKWKNLKDHFYREIKLEESGEANKKRRYVYYDDMEFMRPFVGFRLPHLAHNRALKAMKLNASNQEAANNSDIDIDMDSIIEEDKKPVFNKTATTPAVPAKSVRVIKFSPKAAKPTKPSTSTPHASSRLKKQTHRTISIPKRSSLGPNSQLKMRDGDIAFCLSLVPTLRKMADSHKLRAKIELLQVLQWYTEDMERREMNMHSQMQNHSDNVGSNSDDMNNTIEYDVIEEDMVADYLEEYDDDGDDQQGISVKQESAHYSPVNSAGGTGTGNNSGKVWWT